MGIDAAGTFTLGDLEVHRLGFGAMRITGDGIWGPPDDLDAAKALLHRVIDLGVDLIDTADSYGPEISENLIAEALHPYPEGLVIATKGGLVRSGPDDWSRNGRPEHLREALEGSLQRLRVDTIDVYQLHAVDPDVPLEDQVGVLAEAKEQGKIRHAALSNVRVEQLERARGIVDIVSVQNRYNLADRKHEAVVDYCTEHGIGFIPWYPLAAGDLPTGGPLAAIAEGHAATRHQVALAWLLARSEVMLPIPGTADMAHLEQNVAAADLELGDDELRALDDLA